MLNTKILRLINEGKIEELRAALSEEIYVSTLKRKIGAKNRYSAMKKYFSYVKSSRTFCMKPGAIEFKGENYIAFCNSYSLAITNEDIGEITLFNPEEDGAYPDVVRLLHFDGDEVSINLDSYLARAKSLGYRLKKSEVWSQFKHVFEYDGDYFKVGLVDSTFSIIRDGHDVSVFHGGKGRPMTIKNEYGACTIMPVVIEDISGYTVIEIEKGRRYG